MLIPTKFLLSPDVAPFLVREWGGIRFDILALSIRALVL